MFLYKQVHAPWLKHFIYTGEEGLEYIIPGQVFFSDIVYNKVKS